MFVRAQDLSPGTVVESDLCIVGSGAAGIALALRLEKSGLRICVLESGGLSPAPPNDPLYEFESTRLAVATDSRTRAFGGTTTLWSGRWKPQDPIDFAPRPWCGLPGWPIEHSALGPYYDWAAELFSASAAIRPAGAFGGHFPEAGGRIQPIVFSFVKADVRNLGRRFRSALRHSRNVSVYLQSHVLHLATTGNDVRHVEAAAGSSARFQVRASCFILAAGGIENARLLLLSDVGNAHDVVGRYYMDHPKGDCGIVETYRPIDVSQAHAQMRDLGESTPLVGYRLSDQVQREHQLLNSHVFFRPLREKSLLSRLGRQFSRRRTAHAYSVRNHLEQVPSPQNRVALGDKRDAFGLRRAEVSWSLHPQEARTIGQFHRFLREDLQAAAIGELESPIEAGATPAVWPIQQDASHHMGTTRMGREPRHSVVDPDCKVHGLTNLYVAGSSVFPVSGSANPTATLVALALRLADHVQGRW